MRYIVLLLLNLPIIVLAITNLVVQYKLKRISAHRFRRQLSFWVVVIIVFASSFPVYNLLSDKPILDSDELSLFDIVEITTIVFLFYIVNHQRQKISHGEKAIRDLHKEISIKLSKK